jgi:hypothetical protein
MGAPRIRRVGSAKEMENLKDDYITQGYEIVTEGELSALLRKKDYGNVLIHVVLFLFTIGLGNVAYYFYARQAAEQVLLRLEEGRA